MRIPSQIVAGDSVSWREEADRVNGWPEIVSGPSYGLSFSFRGPSAGIDLAGTPAGTGWQFELTPEQTAALNSGSTPASWFWQAIATKGGQRLTFGEGRLTVRPNLAGIAVGGPFDGRSQAEKDLAAVQAEIRARVSGGATLEYTIGNRSLKKEPMAALLELEQRCKRIVRTERTAQGVKNGLGNPGRVGVRFK